MAEEHEDPFKDVKSFAWYVFAIFGAVIFFWYLAGMPGKEDLTGIFIKPLPPLGTGESYGPTLPGAPTSTPNR